MIFIEPMHTSTTERTQGPLTNEERVTKSYSRAANQWGKSHQEKLKGSPKPLRCINSMNTMVLSGTISNRIFLCIKATIRRHIWVKLEIQMSLNVVDTFAVLCIIEEDVKSRFSLNQCTQVLQRETDSYSSRAANQWGKSHQEKLKGSPELLSCIDSMNTMIQSGTIAIVLIRV